jgi:hypothetical protein
MVVTGGEDQALKGNPSKRKLSLQREKGRREGERK